MVTAVIVIHIVVCFALCIVILLQQGKGAEVGAVFGGSSQTMMGSSSSGNAMTRTTWVLGAAFFATSIFLAVSSAQRATGSIFEGGFSHPAAVATAKAPASKAPLPATAPPGGAAPSAPAKK
jgi:preprotein translocase subunit SecG